MNLDRNLAPSVNPIKQIPFAGLKKFKLDNSSELYYYNDTDSEVIKIELMFPAGSSLGESPLQAGLTSALITSGTSKWSQKEIAEKIDAYGAYFEQEMGIDNSSLVVYSLRKYAEEVLRIIAEVLNDCTFPESELQNILRIRKQKFLINQEKVSFLCRRKFSQKLFGQHPYGRVSELSDYDQISRNDLISFYNDHYKQRPVFFLAGKVDDALLNNLNKLFGQDAYKTAQESNKDVEIISEKGRELITKADALQSSIRMGRQMFTRNHNDFIDTQVLSTVLGGYFGSRLMSNLREDKGFTYGVGSGLVSMQEAGYFFISTEVGADVTKSAEKEILFEVNRLREEKVPASELGTVKNYMLGQLLRGTDGVFELIDRYKALHLYGKKEADFQETVEKIRSMTPEKIQDLAQKYFDAEEFTTVVAGKE